MVSESVIFKFWIDNFGFWSGLFYRFDLSPLISTSLLHHVFSVSFDFFEHFGELVSAGKYERSSFLDGDCFHRCHVYVLK